MNKERTAKLISVFFARRRMKIQKIGNFALLLTYRIFYTMKLNAHFLTVSVIIILASLSRLIPHIPDFTAVSATALFGAACYHKKITAFLVPVIILFLTDAFLGFYQGMAWVYGAFMLVVVIGRMLHKKLTFTRIIAASLVSSLTFYLVTNLGVWLSGTLYPHTASGLSACYVAALPFLRNETLGTLFYSVVLFGAYYMAQRSIPALVKSKA